MKIVQCQQNSLEWLTARAGIVTASEFDNLVTPKFEIRTGEMVKSYLAQKVAEFWIGGPLPGFSTLDMDFGNILEESAIPYYELEFNEPIQRVGLVTTDDGRIGCSPDGLIGEDCGIEIKCPKIETHVKYLLNGEVPQQYLAQVHGSMFVTGRPMWKFMSYHRRCPKLVKVVERDEKIQETLKNALGEFIERLDVAITRMAEINGGMPERKIFNKPESRETEESDGEITP